MDILQWKLDTLMVFTAGLLCSFNLASISESESDIAPATKNAHSNKTATLYFSILL